MEYKDGFVSEEHQELLKCATEGVDPSSISPMEIKSPRSPRSPHGKRSPKKGQLVKHDKHSHNGRDGRPKKGK